MIRVIADFITASQDLGHQASAAVYVFAFLEESRMNTEMVQYVEYFRSTFHAWSVVKGQRYAPTGTRTIINDSAGRRRTADRHPFSRRASVGVLVCVRYGGFGVGTDTFYRMAANLR